MFFSPSNVPSAPLVNAGATGIGQVKAIHIPQDLCRAIPSNVMVNCGQHGFLGQHNEDELQHGHLGRGILHGHMHGQQP